MLERLDDLGILVPGREAVLRGVNRYQPASAYPFASCPEQGRRACGDWTNLELGRISANDLTNLVALLELDESGHGLDTDFLRDALSSYDQ